MRRKWSIRFFSDIAGYFGMSPEEFYPRVVFFNFIPEIIGSKAERYDWAAHEMAVHGSERALRIAETNNLDKLLLFSGKAWESFPQSLEQAEQQRHARFRRHSLSSCTLWAL